MFHAPIDARVAMPSSIDSLFGFREKPVQLPAGMDLCREQVASVDSDGMRFAAAARQSASRNAFRPAFSAAHWHVFSSFCIVRRLPPDFRVLIPGRSDRTLRFLVEGSLWQSSTAAAQAAPGQPKLLQPGSIVGEDAVFSDASGELDVRTLETSVVLELSLPRQRELTAASPAIAFELLRAAGAVIAARGRPALAHGALATN
jgi:CRP/FNR family cyclic AMP-dependent transcriptional regulator